MIEGSNKIPLWYRGDDNSVSLYSSVRVCRNYKNMTFPSSKKCKDLKKCIELTDALVMSKFPGMDIESADVSSLNTQKISFLQKFRILPAKEEDLLKNSRLYYFTEPQVFLLVNYYDHLNFFCHYKGESIEKAYSGCMKVVDAFEKDMFSRDSNGNYHTSDLGFFGSGLKLYSVLTLPSLMVKGNILTVKESFGVNRISFRGFFGSVGKDPAIISSKDSFSKEPLAMTDEFTAVLRELRKTALGVTVSKQEERKIIEKNRELFQRRHLTFGDFIDIYYMLSYMALKYRCKNVISELNMILAKLILSADGYSENEAVVKDITEEIITISEKIIN